MYHTFLIPSQHLALYMIYSDSTQQIIMEGFSVLHVVLSARKFPGKAYTYIRQEVVPLRN